MGALLIVNRTNLAARAGLQVTCIANRLPNRIVLCTGDELCHQLRHVNWIFPLRGDSHVSTSTAIAQDKRIKLEKLADAAYVNLLCPSPPDVAN